MAVSYGTFSGYYPIAHPNTQNFNRERLFDNIASWWDTHPIVMANAAYDVGGLSMHEFKPPANPIDVIIAEALIEEEHPDGNSLESLGKRYYGLGKDETLLRQAEDDLGLPTNSAKKNMDRIPAAYVGAYAERDAALTLAVWQKQKEELERQRLFKLFADTEMPLFSIIHRMVKRGIPLDLSYCDKLNRQWTRIETGLLGKLGLSNASDLDDPKCVQKILRASGVTDDSFPRTAKGNISIAKGFIDELVRQNNPVAATLREAKVMAKCRRDYLVSIMEGSRNGRIHAEFVQGVSRQDDDENGTRTGRLSSKNPNIQQIPKRSAFAEWATKDLRKCYVIDDRDGTAWAKYDFSSQEPMMSCHYAKVLGLAGADEIIKGFAEGAKPYKIMSKLLPSVEYDSIKALSLGRSYGMGVKKMAATLGMDMDDAQKTLDEFDKAFPYIVQSSELATAKANENGYIIMLGGRRRHFNWWEPSTRTDEPIPPVYGYEAAREKWPNARLRRAHTRKAYNALIQGSSGHQTKRAMIQMYEQDGILPYMPVHDEINGPVADEKQALRMKWHMENAVQLKSGARAEGGIGRSWGDIA